MDKFGTGIKGEEVATMFLEENGYQIIAKNVSYPQTGEIDVIAKDGQILCFVEVRTRSSRVFGSPLESITPAKIKKITAAARRYLFENKIYAEGYRFDVVSVLHDKTELLKNAFYARWH